MSVLSFLRHPIGCLKRKRIEKGLVIHCYDESTNVIDFRTYDFKSNELPELIDIIEDGDGTVKFNTRNKSMVQSNSELLTKLTDKGWHLG